MPIAWQLYIVQVVGLVLFARLGLLAVGVVVSYLTLRPRAAATTLLTTGLTTGPTAVAPARESVAVGELATVDELAGELMVADEMAP